MTKKGRLYGLGLGPGDPELVIVKSARLLKECVRIAVPVSGGRHSAALDIAEKICPISEERIILLDMPMTRDKERLSEARKKAADVICACLEKGEDVGFINIGDTTLYSSFSYVADIVSERGYETEYVPGVMSVSAAAAALNISLVKGSEPLIILPADCPDMDKLIQFCGTAAVLKGGTSAENIRDRLLAAGAKTVCAVENCGADDERIMPAAEDISDCGYLTVIISKKN